MLVPLDHLKDAPVCLFPLGPQPWYLPKLLEPGLGLLIGDSRTLRWCVKREGELFGHGAEEKRKRTRQSQLEVEYLRLDRQGCCRPAHLYAAAS